MKLTAEQRAQLQRRISHGEWTDEDVYRYVEQLMDEAYEIGVEAGKACESNGYSPFELRLLGVCEDHDR